MRAKWCGPEIYDVAQALVDSCLRRDGSLFTPGEGVWALDLAEALEGKVGSPGFESGSFVDKLEAQLKGAEPDAIQLAAELLYIQVLSETDTNPDLKLEHVNRILALGTGVTVPSKLRIALGAGGVARFGSGKSHRHAYLRFMLRFLRRWKEADRTVQVRMTEEPWEFLALVQSVRTTRDAMAANALLHLAFPETFEYMIAPANRKALIETFAHAPGVPEVEGDNQKMIQIRDATSKALGREVELYEDPVRRIWRDEESLAWSEMCRWSNRLFERDVFDREERDYKLALAEKIAAVRIGLEKDESWLPALGSAFADKNNNLTSWQAHDSFLKWCEANSDEAGRMLKELWRAEDPVIAMSEFLAALPTSAVKGQGGRISIVSFLLLGIDATGLPFFKPTIHRRFRQILGLESPGGVDIDPDLTYRPEKLAELLGVSGKRVRAFLRDAYERDAEQRGSEWTLTGAQAEAVVSRFGDQSEPNSTVAPYADWRELLEELRLRLLGKGTVLRDLLDAQGLAYWIVQGAPPADWPDEERSAFERFRKGDAPGDDSRGEQRLGNDPERRERTRLEGRCQICEKEVALEEQFTLENDLDNDVVIRKKNAARSGAESMSHYCADCVGEREKGKLDWLKTRRERSSPQGMGQSKSLDDLTPASPELASKLHLPREWLQNTIDLLAEKKQLIFSGPPGTGKTYVAQKLAAHLTEADGTVRLVQFHPSYTYEDFFEGYRPVKRSTESALEFELVPGALRELAEAARLNPGKPHILIVDEINRGNIAKIFGELYYLLEYRDHAIQLQYSRGEEFSIPQNLLVIGTMNTADRSIALVDSALRRRFNFVGFDPVEEPVRGVLPQWLERHGLEPEPAALLEVLNKSIGDSEFSIGPSYFMTSDGSEPRLDTIWRHSIMPLLEEHFYGSQRDVEREFGLEALRKRASEEADAPAEEAENAVGQPPL